MALGSNPKPSILVSLFLFSSSFLYLSFTTLADQYNLQTYFPSLPTPINDIPLPPPPPSPPTCKGKNDNSRVTKAVLATAFSSFAFASLLFFAFYCLVLRRQQSKPAEAKKSSSGLPRLRSSKKSSSRHRGSIVDEDGLDEIYLREFNHRRLNGIEFEREEEDARRSSKIRSPTRIQETPFARAGQIHSSSEIFQDTSFDDSTPELRPIQQLPPPPGRITSQSRKKPTPTQPAPPPPSQPVAKTYTTPRPPPPPPMAKSSANPLPPPTAPKPPPAGRPPAGASSAPRSPLSAAAEGGQKKLKPLHWDKLNKMNVQHSMVWDKITEGSFRYDEDILEALFGSLATNKNTGKDSSDASTSNAAAGSAAPAQVCLLDPRRSQNMAIVLRSLAINRQDIMDALVDGYGLSHDSLERLTSVPPTKEEEELIRAYSGDPEVLAEAEFFLFHIFHATPAPFARLDAMLFRSNYEQEVSQVKQSLQTLEQACKELKTRGLFLKLLEAVLKAGNRMNAGTARGNAKAFNLSALNKLSDVKSTDGSTTLLHFIVQEVVRAEGKRLALNRGYTLRRSDSGTSSGTSSGGQATLDRMVSRRNRAEREKEYSKLGLPIVGGLSDEFANLKKAAGIDYDALLRACSTLGARVAEIRRLLQTTGDDGFTRETKSFVDRAEEELRTVKEEQERVVELVRKTMDYYQPGASKEKGVQPLQIFIIVRDFLSMVDKACVDIARNLQKRISPNSSSVGSPSTAPGSPSRQQPGSASPEGSEKGRRPVVRFPNLPPRFMSEIKSDSSSDDE